MKIKPIILIFVLVFSTLIVSRYALAQDLTDNSQEANSQQQYYQGEVTKIDKEGKQDIDGNVTPYQDLEVKLLEGPDAGNTFPVENVGESNITYQLTVAVGDKIVVSPVTQGDQAGQYIFVDIYRLDYLPFLLIFFVVVVILIAGKKGIGSLIGLGTSLAIILAWIIPQILGGQDPVLISISGSIVILIVTTYLAHGISKQTTLALVSTFIALILTAVLSILVVNATKLFGMTEDAYSLQLNSATANINLRGLLLGGVIIGTLGALNDITTTQAVTMFEMAELNAKIQFKSLIKQGLKVGREHIASLVNTLVLAYAGSSLVAMIVIVLNPQGQPLWLIVNNEGIFDEIIRTIVGSAGLISAVPLVTYLTAWYIIRHKKSKSDDIHLHAAFTKHSAENHNPYKI